MQKRGRKGLIATIFVAVIALVAVGVFYFLPAKAPEYEETLPLTVLDYPQLPERTWSVSYADPQLAALNPRLFSTAIGSDHALLWSLIDHEETDEASGDAQPLILLDVTDGSEVWRLSPADLFGGPLHNNFVWVNYEPGAPYFSFHSEEYQRLLLIDLESGKVVSQKDGEFTHLGNYSDLAIFSRELDETGQRILIEAYEWHDFSTPMWDIELPYSPSGHLSFADHYHVFLHNGLGEAYDMVDGTPVRWARDVELDGLAPPYSFWWALNDHTFLAKFDDPELEFTVYEEVQGEIIRAEHRNRRTTLQGWSTQGESTWQRPVEAHRFYVTPDILLVADRGREPDTFRDLMMIDPKTGTPMWRETYGETLTDIGVGSNPNFIIAADTRGRIVVIDGRTGAELTLLRSGYELIRISSGTDYLYYTGRDEFEAISLADGRTVWSSPQGDLSYMFITDQLIEIDSKNMEIHGLK